MKASKNVCSISPSVFKDDLTKQIEMKTTGNFGKLLTFLLKNKRDLGTPNLFEIARQIIVIKEGYCAKFGASETLIPILAKSSIPHMLALGESFEGVNCSEGTRVNTKLHSNQSVCHLVKSGEFITNPYSYFAEFLKKNIDDEKIEAVIIVACTRCEIDLFSISCCYVAKYGRHPCQDISYKFNGKHPAVVEGIFMLMGTK
ncbi:Annexin A5 [Thelohanellus kitauei]|uniref:Annexin A5 n=1 Tax=Thelohanellus kitauei TaxID=669202 RepID=A0A0C2MVP8_THEKT|nr:Annexin A5 [Thelohanellus kitauei]